MDRIPAPVDSSSEPNGHQSDHDRLMGFAQKIIHEENEGYKFPTHVIKAVEAEVSAVLENDFAHPVLQAVGHDKEGKEMPETTNINTGVGHIRSVVRAAMNRRNITQK